MRRGVWIAGFVLGLWGCSQESCPTGEACEKACNPGESALCVAEGICSCVPGGQLDGGAGAGGAGQGGAGGGGDACRGPQPGELIIDEVMIDGVAPDDENEFIELVNAANEPISVRGVKIMGSKLDDQKERIVFTGGCLPAGTAVAMFRAPDQWVWSDMPDPLPTFETKSFGFTNSADFLFEVRDANDVLLNSFTGSGDIDADGVSVVANPPFSGMAANHLEVAGTNASPGRCFNGGTYANACMDGGGGEGGAGGGEGGAGGGVMQPPLDVRINEVDYDQAGPDDAEFVELYNADAEAADLSNYSLVFTNGADGAEARVVALAGQVGPGDYFVVGAAAVLAALPEGAGIDLGGSIQNGANDGVFLRHVDGTTVDGLSWEGASAGATEGNPTAADDRGDGTIGRCPDGADTNDNATDVAFNPAPSPGAPNNCDDGAGGMGGEGGMGGMGGEGGGMGGEGGGMGGEGGGMGGMGGEGGGMPNDPVALILNEVEVDDEGADDAEYVEILNTGAVDAVLAEYTLEFVNGTNGEIYNDVPLATVMPNVLPAGGIAVVAADSLLAGLPGGVASAELPFSPQNGPDGVRIRHVSGVVTDSMTYQGPIDGWTEGTPAPDDNDSTSLSRCPNGSDTDDNGVDFVQAANSLGAPNVCP